MLTRNISPNNNHICADATMYIFKYLFAQKNIQIIAREFIVW